MSDSMTDQYIAINTILCDLDTPTQCNAYTSLLQELYPEYGDELTGYEIWQRENRRAFVGLSRRIKDMNDRDVAAQHITPYHTMANCVVKGE